MNETVNQRVARYRRAAGLNQKEMAKLLGMKFSTYSEKERKGVIDCGFLLDIAKIININPNILLNGEGSPTSPALYITNQEESLIRIMRDMKPEYRDLAYELLYVLSKNR